MHRYVSAAEDRRTVCPVACEAFCLKETSARRAVKEGRSSGGGLEREELDLKLASVQPVKEAGTEVRKLHFPR